MSEHQRLNTPLRIYNEQLTYESAFYCVSELGDEPMEELPSATRIIYGAAGIDEKDDCYWVKSRKRYKVSEAERLHLIVRIPKNGGRAASYLAEVMATRGGTNRAFTLFYFGIAPTLSSTGKSYVISSDITDDYKRFVVLPDY